MLLIAMTGAKCSGKTTASEVLNTEYGFVRLRFADAVKNMLLAMGLSKNEVDGDAKEKPSVLLGGKTPRFAMQSLGSEWGRSSVSDTLWIDIVWAEINRLRTENPEIRIVIDDCRFANEHAMLLRLGANIWRIRRHQVEPDVTKWGQALARVGIGKRVHNSELSWATLAANAIIANNATRPEFIKRIHGMMAHRHPTLKRTI